MPVNVYLIYCNSKSAAYFVNSRQSENFQFISRLGLTPVTFICDSSLAPLRHWNTGLVSSGVSLRSWGECASLALVGHPSNDGITTKIPYGVDILLHRPALHPIFSYWVG